MINLYGLHLLADDDDVYSKENSAGELAIKTHYEGLDIAQSNRIHYLQFSLNNALPEEKDEKLKKIFTHV